MARGKKTSVKIKTKVIEAKINDPDKSSRDIAKELGGVVSNDTVCDIINENLPQVATESKRIANLIDVNDNLQSLTDIRLEKMLKNWEETIKVSELVSLRESTFKQNQLIGGKATSILQVKQFDHIDKLLEDII